MDDFIQDMIEAFPESEIVITGFGTAKGYCPNPEHHDNNMGSFVITQNANITLAKCFACGYSISPHQLAKKIKKKVKYTKPKAISKEELKEIKKHSLRAYSILDLFFGCEIDNVAANHLKTRGLENDYGYISLPLSKSEMKSFLQECIKQNVDLDKVVGLNKYHNSNSYYFNVRQGNFMLIPTLNTTQDIVGYQLRNMDTTSDLRYFWLSSSQLKMHLNCDVNYEACDISKNIDVVVTEGHFKSRTMATNKQFLGAIRENGILNPVFVSMPGVTHTKALDKCLETLEEYRGRFNSITLVLDKDQWYRENNSVLKLSLKNITKLKTIMQKYNSTIKCITWTDSKSKGIDDLINNQKPFYIKDLDKQLKSLKIRTDDSII